MAINTLLPNPALASALGLDIVGTNNSETLTGTNNDENIIGLGGNDRLEGLAGNDSLFGGTGNDTVQGGIGNDTNTIRDFDDLDFFDGGDGTDHLILAPADNRNLLVDIGRGIVGDLRVGGQTFVNVERFTTGGGNDRLVGDAANNIFQGGAGNDTIQGNGGNDTAIFSDFDDIDLFDGGSGVDHLILTPTDNRNLLVDVARGIVGDLRVGGQNFVNVERFTTGGGNDRLVGDAANNIFQGGAGNDTIQGNGGDDTAIFSDFDDIDLFDGGSGVDHLILTPTDNRNLLVDVARGIVGDLRVGGQNFVNVERFTTGGGNDRLVGDGLNNILEGGAGNDTLQGGIGSDLLVGGAGSDRFIFDSLNDVGDTISDFVVASDSLQINAANFGAGLQAGTLNASQWVLGSVATDSSDRFLYDSATGQLLFDADGTGANAAVQVATFTNKPALSASNLVIEGTAPVTSSFDIEINFTDSSLSASQQAIFTNAAARWAEIIVEDIPDVSISGFGFVDDLVIDARAVDIDGSGGENGNILGQAGPTLLRNSSSLPARGIMEFDSFDVNRLEANGQLEDVILHEMGHVLGIGTIWDNQDLITGAGGSDPRFLGAQATAEYNRLFGVSETSVPVANVGGAGTRDSHWRESTFGNELMTGRLNAGFNPISRVTIGSLADLGYTVNLGAADPYTPPSNLVALSSESGGSESGGVGSATRLEVEGEFIRTAAQVLPV